MLPSLVCRSLASFFTLFPYHLLLLLLATLTLGCGGADPPAEADSRMQQQDNSADDVPALPPEPQTSFAENRESAAADSGALMPPSENPSRPTLFRDPPAGYEGQASNGTTPAEPLFLEPGTATAESIDPGPGALRADLSPSELRDFLTGADSDMQLIASGRAGITDPQQALARMQQIVKLKLQASRQLRDHPDADADAVNEGARGELQSLSHLAALGDLKAAEELEKLARNNLQSADARLVSDSQLVLLGFELENLQNGDSDAAAKIMKLVQNLANTSMQPDIPTMMVMGQAKQMLAQYGHDSEALQVRDTIIDLFADSNDPQVAKMAAQIAGNVQFDEIDRLLRRAMEGQSLEIDQWTQAIDQLIQESPDLQTVQYLAGTALQFEALEQDAFAEVTYEKLADQFADADSALGQEAQLAISARQSRQQVIGKTFDPDLRDLQGEELSMADYRGKVVLMPLWAMGFPESLQLMEPIQKVAAQSPDRIAVVGVNLDPADAAVAGFVKENNLNFPSYRAESSVDIKGGNEVASRFGMVSMPFLVVIDQQGRVAAINYTMNQLKNTLARLLSDPS